MANAAGSTLRIRGNAAVKRFMGESPHSRITNSPAAFAQTPRTRDAQRRLFEPLLCVNSGVLTHLPFENWLNR